MAEGSLSDFIDEASAGSRLRVEQDLGGGFVRLRTSEAERRQAAQDIRSSEDALVELLRNARDAGARHIFTAFQREGAQRTITVIDDGSGVPEAMHERIFEPRVTSKLDSAHMDKWGMHGRGMALFSIRENAEQARVAFSAPGIGTALTVVTDTASLSERADQSTFPHFELKDGVAAMRGPRNLLRTAAEFALEHRDEVTVFCGSPAEVAAALLAFGMATTTPALRAFGGSFQEQPLVRWLACAPDPATFAERAALMGLELSERTARRVLDGQVEPPLPLRDLLEAQLTAGKGAASRNRTTSAKRHEGGPALRLTEEDRCELAEAMQQAFAAVAERYYLDPSVKPRIAISGDSLSVIVPLVPER